MPKLFKYSLILFAVCAVAGLAYTTFSDKTPGEEPKKSYYDLKTKNDSAFIKAKERLNDTLQ